jgi:uncharacterized protein
MAPDEFRDRYGPVALVTGASSGIGWAFAEELADRGFDLALSARRTDRLEELGRKLEKLHGTQCRIVTADLTDTEAPAAIAEETADLDIGLLVSNAGYNIKGPHETKEPAAMVKMTTVNCIAPMLLAHGFIPRLKARGKGGIIFTGSVEGFIGMPFSAVYSASKALVRGLAEGLWGELHIENIDVLNLAPGATESEATAKLDPKWLPNLQPAREVAQLALDNICNGPSYIPSDHYRAQFDELLSGPRREVLAGMAENLRNYAVPS